MAIYDPGVIAGRLFASGTLSNGTEVSVPMAGATLPCTIAIKPVSGDTVTYWYTVDGTNWVSRGVVTAYAEDVIDAPVLALKFQRTAGSGTTSTWAVTV